MNKPVAQACIAVDLVLLVGLVIWRPWGPIPMVIVGTVLFAGALTGLLLIPLGPDPAAARVRTAARVPTSPPAPEPVRRQWERAVEHHRGVLSAYGAYELDPSMLLKYPAMWDLSAPAVTNFHDALELVGSLATDDYPDEKSARDYVDAVTMLRRDWAAADRFARSTGTANLAQADAAACERALKVWNHADGTDGHERAAYLKQVIATIDTLSERGVITAPEQIQAQLATQVRKAIEK
ncbi:hypothetical protein [Gordonia crocea]|uniref:Uncharacterized protein n=1 Tax=Gordonia crocea TaxID=589162 RepID=A0A7I9UVA7_9ACTN|nr:hypothetical protein [Gordonia crocea]GED97118.1 hypothetical protein nbrc107697_11570 [Gordonia crocea]